MYALKYIRLCALYIYMFFPGTATTAPEQRKHFTDKGETATCKEKKAMKYEILQLTRNLTH